MKIKNVLLSPVSVVVEEERRKVDGPEFFQF